jgi:hypothetical protein
MAALVGAGATPALATSSAPTVGESCFSAHRQAGPLTTLAQAGVCAPNATVYTTMPALHDGETAILYGGHHYSVVFASPSTATPPVAAPQAASYCGTYWRNFSQQHWWFGNAAGNYQPRGYQYFQYPYGPWGCIWYANMTANSFNISWCICPVGYNFSQGTYDSNWANRNGYGYWSQAWVNGMLSTLVGPFPVWYSFYCRAGLYPNGALSYPGCNQG